MDEKRAQLARRWWVEEPAELRREVALYVQAKLSSERGPICLYMGAEEAKGDNPWSDDVVTGYYGMTNHDLEKLMEEAKVMIMDQLEEERKHALAGLDDEAARVRQGEKEKKIQKKLEQVEAQALMNTSALEEAQQQLKERISEAQQVKLAKQALEQEMEEHKAQSEELRQHLQSVQAQLEEGGKEMLQKMEKENKMLRKQIGELRVLLDRETERANATDRILSKTKERAVAAERRATDLEGRLRLERTEQLARQQEYVEMKEKYVIGEATIKRLREEVKESIKRAGEAERHAVEALAADLRRRLQSVQQPPAPAEEKKGIE